MSASQIIGIVGAGTMGSGIAELAVQAGARTLLYDPDEVAAARCAQAVGPTLQVAGALGDLSGCQLVIEAAPERLELKQELFAALSRIAPQAVLASTTASIPITAIAAAAVDPARVVGMHFFDPPVSRVVVEVIAGLESSPDALAVARAAASAMGRRVIDTVDGVGFLVDRCSRPVSLEALRLVQEGIAEVEVIDAIVRAAGFPMGPFERQDVVGLDACLQASTSAYEQSFGEPRWRPSPLLAQLVSAGRLGRRTGHGWYRYPEGGSHRPEDPAAAVPAPPDGDRVVISGILPVADELRELADEAGWHVDVEMPDEVPWLILECGPAEDDAPPLQAAPRAVLCAEGALAALDGGGTAAGFHALSPIGLVELTRTAGTTAVAIERTERFFASLGRATVRVGDAPGLVLGRIVAQLVNECAFAIGEGVGTAEEIDAGMVFGLDHPRGPLAWADAIGLDHIVMLMDGLHEEYGEERYRVAPLLRRIIAFHEPLRGDGAT